LDFDVFAENDAPWIRLSAQPQGFVHGISDPIFAWRQNFLVNLALAGHVWLRAR